MVLKQLQFNFKWSTLGCSLWLLSLSSLSPVYNSNKMLPCLLQFYANCIHHWGNYTEWTATVCFSADHLFSCFGIIESTAKCSGCLCSCLKFVWILQMEIKRRSMTWGGPSLTAFWKRWGVQNVVCPKSSHFVFRLWTKKIWTPETPALIKFLQFMWGINRGGLLLKTIITRGNKMWPDVNQCYCYHPWVYYFPTTAWPKSASVLLFNTNLNLFLILNQFIFFLNLLFSSLLKLIC